MEEANVFRISTPFAVTYSRTSSGGEAQLSYRDVEREMSFSGEELDRRVTAMGERVTVTLESQVDAFEVRITVIVPTVRVVGGEDVEFETTAIETTDRTHAFVPAPGPLGALQSYRIHQVRGTAQVGQFNESE